MSGLPAGEVFECTGRTGTPAKELVLRWLDSSVCSTHGYFVKLGGEQGLIVKIARYRSLESDEPIEIGNKMLIALLRRHVKEEPHAQPLPASRSSRPLTGFGSSRCSSCTPRL